MCVCIAPILTVGKASCCAVGQSLVLWLLEAATSVAEDRVCMMKKDPGNEARQFHMSAHDTLVLRFGLPRQEMQWLADGWFCRLRLVECWRWEAKSLLTLHKFT